ncbi:MAG: helix-turn-helix domain-containing protein [Halopseudomonas aestusnigri]
MTLPTKTYLNEHEVSDLLQVPVPTLRRWRFTNQGPNYHKFGRSVRYSQADLEHYTLEASRR